MRSRVAFAVAAMAAALTLTSVSRPAVVEGAPQGTASSTLDDQTELSLTVYNSDLALVRDVRNVTLAPGASDLHFMDIAATVNPATVHFRSLTDPQRVRVVEQNYEYDLLEPDKLLRKYVGREVTLVRKVQDAGTTREETVTATLVSYNNAPVWRIGNEIVTGLQADHIRFPELPGNLYSHPTLIWTVANDGGTKHRVEASYLAGKLGWSADYVLTVGRDEKAGDLDGWVTLTNNSGTSFNHASLQLVAGNLNRVQDVMLAAARTDAKAARMAEAPMTQESFSEYHLYTLGHKTSINNSETKQVSMLSGTGVPVRKRYVVDGQAMYYRNVQHPGSPLRDDVAAYYEFKNDTASGLGMPLPAGTVRVYQADSKGGTQFAGEDRIDHTPKDETLSLRIGTAFDVVCERTQTSFQKIGTSTYEVGYSVVLRNHKAVPIEVAVNEPIGGSWRMVTASHPWKQTSAWASSFTVPVAADGTATLTYRVVVTY
jgi:hypothetical protein